MKLVRHYHISLNCICCLFIWDFVSVTFVGLVRLYDQDSSGSARLAQPYRSFTHTPLYGASRHDVGRILKREAEQEAYKPWGPVDPQTQTKSEQHEVFHLLFYWHHSVTN